MAGHVTFCKREPSGAKAVWAAETVNPEREMGGTSAGGSKSHVQKEHPSAGPLYSSQLSHPWRITLLTLHACDHGAEAASTRASTAFSPSPHTRPSDGQQQTPARFFFRNHIHAQWRGCNMNENPTTTMALNQEQGTASSIVTRKITPRHCARHVLR